MRSVVVDHKITQDFKYPVYLPAHTDVITLTRISEWLISAVSMDQYLLTADGTYMVWFQQADHAVEFALIWG